MNNFKDVRVRIELLNLDGQGIDSVVPLIIVKLLRKVYGKDDLKIREVLVKTVDELVKSSNFYKGCEKNG